MGIFKKKEKESGIPGLNTASLPDLIFTVLFFFMIVTNMRQDEILVRYEEPDGKELAKLKNKSTATNIYIGTDLNANEQLTINSEQLARTYKVQVDSRIIPINKISAYMKKKMAEQDKDEKQKSVVTIRADKKTPMKIVKAVKQQLQQADARNVYYSADEKD